MSLIRAISSKKKPGAIDLGLGEPTLLPQARFLDAAARWASEFGVKYTANAGDAALRDAVGGHYRYPGMDAACNVCITNGSQEAVFATIKTLLNPARDAMLVVEPAYPAYAKIAQLEGIAVETVGMRAANDFRYDADAIVAALTPKTRLIVIGSPSNPTGAVLRRADAQRLAAALTARGGEPVWVLHDELYRELTYVDDAAEMARIYPYTIAVNGLSKSNALTGLRIGWAIAPATFIDEFVKVHAWMTSTASTFSQRVALEIFREAGALQEQAAWYREQRAAVLPVLRDSGLTFVEPDGAFYACVKLPHGNDSLAAALRLVEHFDVVAIPGRTFGDNLEGWLRLSWVAAVDDVREGLARIAKAVLV